MATDADATTLSPNAFSKEAENQTVNTANSRAKKTKEQSALAFSKEILGKINDNNAVTKGEGITVKEFLRQAEGYKEYRAYFSAHPEFVVKLVSESPVEAVVDIKGLVSNSPELVAAVEPVPEGAGNLTQFKQADEKLDQSTPIEVVSGAVRDKAWEETISTVQQIRQKTDTKVVRFFKILEEKKVYGTKEELEAAKREIDKPFTQLTPDEARAEISRRLQKTGAANEQEAQRAAAEYCEETGLDRDFAAIAQSIDVVAKNPEITTPNIIFESIARGDKAEDAIRLSRMATVVNAPESFIKQPIARMNSAFVDAARTVFPGVTQTTITDVVARTWEGATKAEGFVEEMTRRGVNKEALDSLVMEGNKQFSERRGGGISNIFSGFSGFGVSNKEMYDYIELQTFQPSPDFNPNKIAASVAYGRHPELFPAGASPLDWLVGLGVNKAAGGGAAAAETAAGGTVGTFTREAAQGAALKFLSTFLPAAAAEWLSGPLGWAVFIATAFWDKIKGALAAVGNWVATGANRGVAAASRGIGELIQSYLSAPAPKREWYDNPLYLAPLLAIGVAVLLWSTAAAQNKANQMNFIPADLGGVEGASPQVTLICPNFTNAHIYQYDSAWSGITCAAVNPDPNVGVCTAPNTACAIGPSGCGSATMTEILNGFGLQHTVVDVWIQQHKVGGYLYTQPGEAPSCLTDNDKSFGVLTTAGLSVTHMNPNELESIFDAPPDPSRPQDCTRVVYASGCEKFTNSGPSGHIVAIVGVQKGTNDVTALDPARPEQTTTLHLVDSCAAATSNYDYHIDNIWLVVNNKGAAQ